MEFSQLESLNFESNGRLTGKLSFHSSNPWNSSQVAARLENAAFTAARILAKLPFDLKMEFSQLESLEF